VSDWVRERIIVARYLLGGMGNTLVGFSLIFGLMWMGFSSYIANIVGYSLSLVMGFVVSRLFVFNSNPENKVTIQAVRYGLAFACCFLVNLMVLKIAIEYLEINKYFSQLIASGSYTTAMYLFSRQYIFKL